MGWEEAFGNILNKYTGAGGGTGAAPDDPTDDYDNISRAAPRESLASSISEAFKSDRTPAFPDMISKLFSNSDSTQRAGLLNRILGAAGPGIMGSLPGLGGLSGLLSGAGQVSPEQASRIQPEQVREIAAQAEKNDPSVVDQVSDFFSQHPGVLKALGGVALGVVLQQMAKRR